MRKIILVLLLLCLGLSAGCAVARKPVPEPTPDPKLLVVPEVSKVGYSPVDLNKAPDVVKFIASDIAKKEAATWVQVNGTSYIMVSAGENSGNKVEITEVLQRVPAEEFIWIEAKAKYIGAKEAADNGAPLVVISLKLSDRIINGVGFEIAGAASTAPSQTTQPSPTPAAPTTPAPAAPAPVTPAPTPAPTAPEPATPEPAAPAPQNATPEPAAKKVQTLEHGRSLQP